MSRFIAFLRAVNVGGRTVKMDELRVSFEALGFTKVETFIASGNVIFDSRARDDVALQRKIEVQLQKSLGYEVKTFVRSDAEVAAVAQYQPFGAELMKSMVALNVAFLAEPPSAEAQQALHKLKTDIDEFHVHDREIYWLCRKKQSESTFSNAVLEKTLKLRATLRGMNTLLKLAAKYPV